MLAISYLFIMALITIVWAAVRAGVNLRKREFCWKREAQLLLMYVCLVVVARFTFFPFSKVDGVIQPLVFDSAKAYPFRINWIPFVNLCDYEDRGDVLLNVIGNTTMFVPIGIVYPIVYKKLDTHTKVILAGVCFSLVIEILQLPFFDRVSDIDDLILNSAGYVTGYLLYLAVKRLKKSK